MNSRRQSVPGLAVLLAVVMAAGGVVAMTAGAADPNQGTVSLEQTNTGWNGKEYATGATSVPESRSAQVVCAVPTDYVCDAAGNVVGSAANAGTSSERVFIEDATGEYKVRVVPWDVTDSGYAGGAWIESRADVAGGGSQGTPPNPGCRKGQ